MLTTINTTEEKLLHAQETTLRWFEAVEKNNLMHLLMNYGNSSDIINLC